MVAHRRSIDEDIGIAADPTRRMCALTRAERPTSDLIRFVAAPDSTIVADLSCKLPGRGVWITADAASVSDAVKKKAFARSLKRPVEAPQDISTVIEAQLLTRCSQALAIANKAGQALSGFDKISGLIDGGSVLALAHASDAAAGGCEKLDRKFQAVARSIGRDALIINALNIDQMSLAMGRLNVVHAALITGGAARKFISEALRLTRFRTGIEPAAEIGAGRNF